MLRGKRESMGLALFRLALLHHIPVELLPEMTFREFAMLVEAAKRRGVS